MDTPLQRPNDPAWDSSRRKAKSGPDPKAAGDFEGIESKEVLRVLNLQPSREHQSERQTLRLWTSSQRSAATVLDHAELQRRGRKL